MLSTVGAKVGSAVGLALGGRVGSIEGLGVGALPAYVGSTVGGTNVGCLVVGSAEGMFVGRGVGAFKR